VVSYTPFQVFGVASFYDLESEEFLEEPLDALDPSLILYMLRDISGGMNFSSFDGDPIYDIEGCFQTKNMELFPSKQPYVIANNSEVWQHEDDMITNLYQAPRDDSLQHSKDDF